MRCTDTIHGTESKTLREFKTFVESRKSRVPLWPIMISPLYLSVVVWVEWRDWRGGWVCVCVYVYVSKRIQVFFLKPFCLVESLFLKVILIPSVVLGHSTRMSSHFYRQDSLWRRPISSEYRVTTRHFVRMFFVKSRSVWFKQVLKGTEQSNLDWVTSCEKIVCSLFMQ